MPARLRAAGAPATPFGLPAELAGTPIRLSSRLGKLFQSAFFPQFNFSLRDRHLVVLVGKTTMGCEEIHSWLLNADSHGFIFE
jgi:hypothetical protein